MLIKVELWRKLNQSQRMGLMTYYSQVNRLNAKKTPNNDGCVKGVKKVIRQNEYTNIVAQGYEQINSIRGNSK